MEKLNIILDIDGMLDLDEGAEVQEFLPKDVLALLDDSFIDVCFDYEGKQYSCLHYLLPGCIEFIKAILDLPNVRLIFFSHGVKPRNVDFVKKIMDKIASSNNNYASKEITIFSREY